MTYRWNLTACDSTLLAHFVRQLQVPPVLARCLLNRGCTSLSEAERYLDPRLAHLSDPFLLPGMERAVERLLRAHRERERIVLFGDYDVDGVTSTALLREFFEELGWHTDYYLPHRLDEGYGLSPEAVERCLERSSARLLIAIDCGSSSPEVVRALTTRGVDVIILDHHQVSSPPPLPCAFINPQISADGSGRNLCSAGLAFKLAHALLKRTRTLGWAAAENYDLRETLDLVALGTIADIVPLQGENRILAKIGLQRLSSTKRIGLAALKKVAGLTGEFGCSEVGYQLGPRLNAAGRLETALDALELLLTREVARADALAAVLNEQNRQRQEIEKKIAEEVVAQVRARFRPELDFAIVEGHSDWHIGVVGIVASRVQREFHRPTIILGGDGPDRWRGSGRSVRGFDLAAGLRSCSEIILRSGGHAMAAGLSMVSSQVNALRTRLNELVRGTLNQTDLEPLIDVDGEVQLSELNFQSLKALARLQPVGQGNPPVHFIARKLILRGEPRFVGSGQQHCKLMVSDGAISHQALWWNCRPPTEIPARFDLAFAPELNEFNGTFGLQLKVLDLRAHV